MLRIRATPPILLAALLLAAGGLQAQEPALAPAPEAVQEPAPEPTREPAPEPTAEAAEAVAPATPWLGEIAVGLVNATGNTRTRSMNLRSALEYRAASWGNRFSLLAYSGSRDGTSTDERYSIANKLDYQFGGRNGAGNYAYGNLAYDNDRFAGIAERYAATVGYGRHLLRKKRHRLDVELGVGANRTRDQDDLYETAAIATLGGKYVWTISPSAEFTQTLRTEAGVTNVYVNPISALKLTVIGNLFATFNHEVRYNTEVPAETRHVDQITTINLGYAFGTPPS